MISELEKELLVKEHLTQSIDDESINKIRNITDLITQTLSQGNPYDFCQEVYDFCINSANSLKGGYNPNVFEQKISLLTLAGRAATIASFKMTEEQAKTYWKEKRISAYETAINMCEKSLHLTYKLETEENNQLLKDNLKKRIKLEIRLGEIFEEYDNDDLKAAEYFSKAGRNANLLKNNYCSVFEERIYWTEKWAELKIKAGEIYEKSNPQLSLIEHFHASNAYKKLAQINKDTKSIKKAIESKEKTLELIFKYDSKNQSFLEEVIEDIENLNIMLTNVNEWKTIKKSAHLR